MQVDTEAKSVEGDRVQRIIIVLEGFQLQVSISMNCEFFCTCSMYVHVHIHVQHVHKCIHVYCLCS